MAIEYNLIIQDQREDNNQCASCKNRLPDKDCAVELAVVNGGAMLDIILSYQDICDQRE